MNCFSIHQAHDAGIAWNVGDKHYAIQTEKITGKRYGDMTRTPKPVIDEICDLVLATTGGEKFDKFIQPMSAEHWFGKWGPGVFQVINRFKLNLLKGHQEGGRTVVSCLHHHSHASVSFYGSPYQEALVITTDGGGDGEWFTISHASRKTGIRQLESVRINLGGMYLVAGRLIGEISSTTRNENAVAGKAMGIVAGGKVNDKVKKAFKALWKNHVVERSSTLQHLKKQKAAWHSYGKNKMWGSEFKQILFPYGIDIDNVSESWAEGQNSRDLMASCQAAFEEIIWESIENYMNKYPDLPICMSGGCALNVLNNQKLLERLHPRGVFVPPCPADEGLAMGYVLDHTRPSKQVRLHDICPPLRDLDKLKSYKEQYKTINATPKRICQMLEEGQIIGYVQGPSEFGPRALGFRSILCDPAKPYMKDKINARIKHREWFRPFAPICREEVAHKYFDSPDFSTMQFMSFAPKVLPKARDLIPAVTHVDYTSRLQTVTSDSNKKMNSLLLSWNKHTGKDVLLNTSFNINGKPILNTIEEALYVLDNTELDAVVVEDTIFLHRKQ